MDIIAITICAVICGADSWVEIEEYGYSKQEWLQKFLALPNGIPSRDTKVNEKSNEITAIPRLLKILEIQGCIVTIDAMGTQKEIEERPRVAVRRKGMLSDAQEIIDQGGDYILSLKGNQGNIHQDVQQLFDWGFKTQFKNIPHEAYVTINKGHGRIEIRRHWLLSSVEYLIDSQLWSGLKRVGLIESERKIKGQLPTIERRYYLLSLDGGVERFAKAVRSHWGIENQLHWCLDVALRCDPAEVSSAKERAPREEDDSRIRSGHASENMALIRHIALNLLSKETSFKAGKKAKRKKAGWDNNYLAKVLAA